MHVEEILNPAQIAHDQLHSIIEREAQQPLDITIGYPELLAAHAPLQKILADQALEVIQHPEHFQRMTALLEIKSFFGFSPNSVVLSSASQALGLVFAHLIHPNDTIASIQPFWPVYSNLLMQEKSRLVRLSSSLELLLNFVERTSKSMQAKFIIVTIPQNPTMATPKIEQLFELANFADEHDITIIYDEVFWGWLHQLPLESNLKGQKISMQFPRSLKHVIVRDTGKVLPAPFFKLAGLEISQELHKTPEVKQLLESARMQHYADPGIVELASMHAVLTSNEFEIMLNAMRRTTQSNFALLNQEVNNITGVNLAPTTSPSPFAVLEIPSVGYEARTMQKLLQAIGLSVVDSHDFNSHSRFIRVPLVVESQKFAANLPLLLSKIISAQHIMKNYHDLQVIRHT